MSKFEEMSGMPFVNVVFGVVVYSVIAMALAVVFNGGM